MRNSTGVFALAAIAAALGAGTPFTAHAASRMDRSRLNIGTYELKPYARTEAHVRDMAECGIDFVIAPLFGQTLDLCAKYNVGVVQQWTLPYWWGGAATCTNGAMRLTHPIERYAMAARKFKDHPAIWGVDTGDEPSALDFSHYGAIIRTVAAGFPNQFPYLNLYPNYALPGKEGEDLSRTQLGATDYRSYIAAYCREIPLDYICYDHYPWGWRNRHPWMFENLRVVSDACTATHRSLWIVLQANRHVEGRIKNRPMTVNTLRYQMNAALAYGAEVILWACWTKGWWTENVLDTNGVKTAASDRLKTVNDELHRLSPDYMRFRRTHTDLVGFGADFAKQLRQPVLERSSGPGFSEVRAADGAALAVGHFVERNGAGAYAIYVAVCDDPEDVAPREHVLLCRPADGRSIRAYGGSGTVKASRRGDGLYEVAVMSSGGVLVVSE